VGTERTCERCGAPLPAGSRFCPNCGAPVRPEGGEERKVVTVLFADLAGSTELASRLDPERYREVMAEFYRLASDEVASLRGRTEKFVGDAVMAVFGLPTAHEDDALRAVRAGLSIRDRAERLGEDLGLNPPLRVRVGINTGAVAAGSVEPGQFFVSGAAVNLAARLQQAAEPGEVLVGDVTWQLTRHAADFGPSRPVRARGFAEDVSACPVVALSTRSSRRTIPLVGRRRELELLVGTFERARESSRAHMVTLIGEPGIGKSRLVEEVLAAVPDEATTLVGRASEFGEDVAFAPVAEMLRRHLALDPDTEPDEIRARLEEVVAGCCDPSEVDQVAARLGLLLGVGEESQRGNPYRAAEIRAGLTTFVAGLARTGPVVMVVDDLHLAREGLLDMLEEIVRESRRLPLLVLAVAREDLLKDRPAWGAGLSDALTLRLESLSGREALELAAAAGEGLDEDTARDVAQHAGGNPFFIIETTGMLLHARGEEPHGVQVEHLLAPTVQAMVASRIDHLPERARNLLRTVSVFPGNAFHESKLALLATVEPDVLRTLEDEEMLVRDQDRPGRWRFRHELLREVAYESVTKRDRIRLHTTVAEGLDELEAAEKHAGQVAFHLHEAARAALDLDPNDRSLARRAIAALRRAGDLARWRMESRAAVELYERALALAGPREIWGFDEAWCLAGTGEARYWLGQYEAAEDALQGAVELAGDELDTAALAYRFLGDIALNIKGDPEAADEQFRRALDASREGKNPWSLARALLTAGWVPYWRRDMNGARAMFEEALEIARANEEGDRWAEARALNSLASLGAPSGEPAASLALAEQALELGREMGDPFTVATAQERRAGSLRAMWRLDEAATASDEAVRIYRDLGARWELASALGDRGNVRRLLGRLDEAETDLREALELCRQLGDRVLVAWTAAELATALVLEGRIDDARKLADDPTLPETMDAAGDRTALLWARTLIALSEGDQEAARALALEALEVERAKPSALSLATSTWWAGTFFGPDAVGGEDALAEAREHLERIGYRRPLEEVVIVKGMVVGVG
jgi:class 3 adenylate cyclase/tetratricopeptide (TPR) repeat protein